MSKPVLQRSGIVVIRSSCLVNIDGGRVSGAAKMRSRGSISAMVRSIFMPLIWMHLRQAY